MHAVRKSGFTPAGSEIRGSDPRISSRQDNSCFVYRLPPPRTAAAQITPRLKRRLKYSKKTARLSDRVIGRLRRT